MVMLLAVAVDTLHIGILIEALISKHPEAEIQSPIDTATDRY